MYCVVDQKDIVFGVGKTAKEARSDAKFWAKENGPYYPPFKSAEKCSKYIYENGASNKGIIRRNNIVYAKDEILTGIANTKCPYDIYPDDFDMLDISDKLNIIHKMLYIKYWDRDIYNESK